MSIPLSLQLRPKGTMDPRPFHMDPSATGAFRALDDSVLAGDVPAEADEPIEAVVIGGGTGAPVSIRTLLSLGIPTSAVVAMADDGGSTGILRDKADVTPPGDIRKCIAAFADDPTDPLVRAFKYRFAVADDHALGNLLLAALEDASGSFPEAIRICERLVNAQGHVYPSTLDHVTLTAHTKDGRTLDGQAVACHSRTALESVSLQSDEGAIRPYRPALKAIESADLIVLGPGSLFTSIIPNLLVPGILEAIQRSRGSVLFVCSLADVQGETWGLSAREHLRALFDHGMDGLVDYMLVHTPVQLRAESPATGSFIAVAGDEPEHGSISDLDDLRLSGGVRPVSITYQDVQAIQAEGPVVLARNLADAHQPTWHDPAALRDAILQVIRLMLSRREF